MRYAILIYDGVEPIDLGATFGVLSMARRLLPEITCFSVAKRAGHVRCANGLTVVADHGFADCPPHDDLIVTGGPGWAEASADPGTIAFLRHSKAKLTAICTGAMILAAAGRLDGAEATTKSEVFGGEVAPMDILAKRHSAVRVRPAAVVDSNGIVTSGGVSLGIDGVLYLIGRNHGSQAAREIARVFEYSRAFEANHAALGHKISEEMSG